jgi:hypothetical protein
MATTYKVLGQSAPAATTNTSLYTVPELTQTIVSTLTICNRGNTAATYRVAVRPDGATLANEHYLAFDTILDSNNTTALTLGMTLDAGDIITIYASNTNFSFTAFGSEIVA